MSQERLIPLSTEALERDHFVALCLSCKSDTEHANNSACGDPECCGPNHDFCYVCGEES